MARIGFLALALTLAPRPALAQPACSGWPGAAFGITSYKCTDCAIDTKDKAHPTFTFGAEPVVLQAEPSSGFASGDVVVAINRQPITTRAGADGFANPSTGPTTLTVRRDGKPLEVSKIVRPEDCQRGRVAATKPDLNELGEKVRSLVEAAERIQAVTVRTRATSAFGFAVDCQPSCSRTRAADGTTLFWRFDGPPTIVKLEPSGPAAVAGVKVGDRLIEVEGVEVQTDEGSLLLLKSQDRQTLRLTIMRGSERLTFNLKR